MDNENKQPDINQLSHNILERRLEIFCLRDKLRFALGQSVLGEQAGWDRLRKDFDDEELDDIAQGTLLKPDDELIGAATRAGMDETAFRKSLRIFEMKEVTPQRIFKAYGVYVEIGEFVASGQLEQLIAKHVKKDRTTTPELFSIRQVTVDDDHANLQEGGVGDMEDLEEIFGQDMGSRMKRSGAAATMTDSPLAMVLCYDSVPQAKLAFRFDEGYNALLISETQGINLTLSPDQALPGDEGPFENPTALGDINWRRVFFDILEKIAAAQGIDRIGVIGNENARWLEPRKGFGKEQHKRSYDTPAQKYGFRYGDDGNLYKSVVVGTSS